MNIPRGTKRAVALLTAIVVLVGMVQHDAFAASINNMSDTMTRLKINQTADHSISFALPTGINWDSTGSTDDIIVDFPEAATDFVQSGTWQASDFTANDGSALTVTAVNSAAGSLTYPSCGTGVVVAIDTTNIKFGFRRCTGNSANAATVVLGILGASGGTGTLTNGSTIGSKSISLSHTDEGVADTNTGSFAIPLTEDDQVTATATVSPSITFDLDAYATSNPNTDTTGTNTIALGTLTPSSIKTSDESAINALWLDLSTNAYSGATVTIVSANNGLKSSSLNYTIPAAGSNATMTAGTELFGVCVKSATATTGTLTAGTRYNSSGGNCDTANTATVKVGGVTTTANTLVSTTGVIAGGRAEILFKAAISAITPAANDYTDTMTLIATGTF